MLSIKNKIFILLENCVRPQRKYFQYLTGSNIFYHNILVRISNILVYKRLCGHSHYVKNTYQTTTHLWGQLEDAMF